MQLLHLSEGHWTIINSLRRCRNSRSPTASATMVTLALQVRLSRAVCLPLHTVVTHDVSWGHGGINKEFVKLIRENAIVYFGVTSRPILYMAWLLQDHLQTCFFNDGYWPLPRFGEAISHATIHLISSSHRLQIHQARRQAPDFTLVYLPSCSAHLRSWLHQRSSVS